MSYYYRRPPKPTTPHDAEFQTLIGERNHAHCVEDSDTPADRGIRIYYHGEGKDGGELVNFVTFKPECPPSEEQLADFRKMCMPSKFNRRGVDVYDPTYRLAQDLVPSATPDMIGPGNFATTFELAQYPTIMATVQRALCPTAEQSLSAELYKVNVYGPDGHFNVHRDTPTDPEMIGSLVVCLPHAFEGGDLVLSHLGTDHSISWAGVLHTQSNGPPFTAMCHIVWSPSRAVIASR